MLSTCVFLAVVAGCFLYTDGTAEYKCDEAVIKKVKKLGEHSGMLPELATFGILSITKSTEDYLDSDVSCISIKFYQEGDTTKEILHFSFKEKEKIRARTVEVVESEGSYSVKAPTGTRAGFVAVGSGYSQETLTDALNALTSVGVSVTETYPDTCP